MQKLKPENITTSRDVLIWLDKKLEKTILSLEIIYKIETTGQQAEIPQKSATGL